MGILDGFEREESAEFEPNKGYWGEITKTEDKVSSSGNKMLVLSIKLNGAPFEIRDYIVKNEYFNGKVTRIMDCFGINETDTDILTWIGAIGYVKLKEDGEYFKIGKYIPLHKAEGEWKGEKPERMAVTDLSDLAGDEVEDSPF